MARANKGKYKYSETNLMDAFNAVKEGKSVRAAAKEFNVPRSTIMDHLSGKSQVGVRAGRKQSIPADIENAMVDKVIHAAQSDFPLTKQQFKDKVGVLAKKMSLKTAFRNDLPGDDYWRGVKARRPDLVVRMPEGCNTNRMRGMNMSVVMKYFDNLEEIIINNNIQPNCIWNADETGMQFSPRPSQVLAKIGSKELLTRTNNSNDSITLMVTINAVGEAMPPLCVTKGKTTRCVQSFATLDAPTGTVWTYQENAWRNNTIGVEWFLKLFIQNCGPQRPQLLILDSHGSHEVVELLELARQNNILVMALPPHATHMLQPLDRVVFAPFKKAYRRQCTEFMTAHPRHVINKTTWPRILKTVWDSVMTQDLLKKAFEATGIHPCNRTAVPQSAFRPVEVLNRCTPEEGDEDTINIATTSTAVATDDDRNRNQELEEEAMIEEINITMEDVAGLDGLLIEMEGGETMRMDLNAETDLPVSADWNVSLNEIFDIPSASTPYSRKKPNSRTITGHRLLTSDEIYKVKVAQRDEKERKECEKQLGKEKRMQKSSEMSKRCVVVSK